jgi:hypothetical protein
LQQAIEEISAIDLPQISVSQDRQPAVQTKQNVIVKQTDPKPKAVRQELPSRLRWPIVLGGSALLVALGLVMLTRSRRKP